MSLGVLPPAGELTHTKQEEEGKPNSSSVLKCSLVWEKERHSQVKDEKKMWSVDYSSPFSLFISKHLVPIALKPALKVVQTLAFWKSSSLAESAASALTSP